MRHGSRCSIPKQKGSQNNGNIQTCHPRKNSELARLQRKFSIQFSGTRRVLFTHILSQRAWPSPENVRDILKNQLPAAAEKRPELVGNFILHQDNAPPHKARIVTEFLVEQGIQTVRHPPYSPDLAPSDFWLFDTLKLSLRRRFPSRSSLGSAVYQSLKHIPKDSYKNAMKSGLGVGNCG